jgi:hypothetical protein
MKQPRNQRRQAMVMEDSVLRMDLCAARRHGDGLPAPSQPFILVSFLGLAWGLAHVGMEALMGAGLVKLGLPVTAVWAVMLVRALRGQGWATFASVVLGALGCYWLTMMHYYNSQLHWYGVYGVIPWMTNPEHAGPAWAWPYNILVYAGALIGLAHLWTSARELKLGLDLRQGWFMLLVSGVLVASGVAAVVLHAGLGFVGDDKAGVYDRLMWVTGVGLGPLIVMTIAVVLPYRKRGQERCPTAA